MQSPDKTSRACSRGDGSRSTDGKCARVNRPPTHSSRPNRADNATRWEPPSLAAISCEPTTGTRPAHHRRCNASGEPVERVFPCVGGDASLMLQTSGPPSTFPHKTVKTTVSLGGPLVQNKNYKHAGRITCPLSGKYYFKNAFASDLPKIRLFRFFFCLLYAIIFCRVRTRPFTFPFK